ncbi:methyl-accepting chemotaxis protein [Massilia cavernae]|uniref:Chemotaxis protein n=1 Tax=Massilia cavernae TaxID=2320864 RepID=A0A418XGQ8_9BURK|nr:methyl-accepting chemotaxis protein [Massilia cavernae]RJG11649.1 chemotaxis protein [Massilia cavernae]
MSIKRKIWALPAISALIFSVGVGASAYIAAGALESIRTTGNADYPVLDNVKAISLQVTAITDGLQDAVAEGDKPRLEQIGAQAAQVRGTIGKVGQLPGQRELATRLGKEFDGWYAPALSAARIMLELEQGDAGKIVARMQAAQAVLNASLAKTNANAQANFKAGIAASEASVRKVLWTIVAAALAVIASLAIVSWFVVRDIWKQLGGEPEYARTIARAVADGDLSMEIATDAGDSTSLLVALRDMRAKLAGMVAEIKRSADTINVASAEIASGNADLAARTESQAANIDQTTRAMQVLTNTVRENVGHASDANALVTSASDEATRGGQVVNGVVTTMGEINSSARKIVDIISVIDGIAFQTNILALNAAVEAARAGEQGRGFAVVAAEVRNLAQRSAAAAKEIKELIGDSVAKVEAGSQLVDQAGVTMDQIVESVRKVAAIMAEINASSREQNSGIEEIGRAIASMDAMTQQNSALVEEAAAAAESLSDQTEQLSNALGVFKLAAIRAAVGRPARPALALEG